MCCVLLNGIFLNMGKHTPDPSLEGKTHPLIPSQEGKAQFIFLAISIEIHKKYVQSWLFYLDLTHIFSIHRFNI